jgi:hypothetical protein
MKLTDDQIKTKAKTIGIEPAALKALAIVESNGDGFLPNGQCKILFEGHIFWRQLVIAGINPSKMAFKYPHILYEVWDKTKYVGGEGEYQRLEIAKLIHNDAALKSASWGMFQIMGFNHKICGFADISEFVESMQQNEFNHLNAVISFLQVNNWLKYLREKNWAGFAYKYNGPGFSLNNYDTKLQTVYEQNLNIN